MSPTARDVLTRAAPTEPTPLGGPAAAMRRGVRLRWRRRALAAPPALVAAVVVAALAVGAMPTGHVDRISPAERGGTEHRRSSPAPNTPPVVQRERSVGRPDGKRASSGTLLTTPRPTVGAEAIAALGLRGRLAYEAGGGIRLLDLATGRDTAVTATGGYPALSPNGLRIAYTRDGGAAGLDSTLHVMGSDGRDDREIFARTGARVVAPAWSPDVGRIAFAVHTQSADSWRDGWPDSNSPWDPAGVREIWVVNADGTNAHRIDAIPRERYASEPAWSPDGNRLAFSDTSGRDVVFVLDLGTGRITEIADGLEPAWSPDGRRIAVARNFAIDIVNTNDLSVETTIRSDQVPNGTGGSQREHSYSSPAWSPDGAWLAFQRDNSTTGSGGSICVVRPDGRDLTVVAFGGAPNWSR